MKNERRFIIHEDSDWNLPTIESYFEIIIHEPSVLLKLFTNNGFLNSPTMICSWGARVFFVANDDKKNIENVENSVRHIVNEIKSGSNDLEIILKLKTFTSYYFDTPEIDYLAYYDETFENKKITYSYELHKLYEGNFLYQKQELDVNKLSNFKIKQVSNFDLYVIYKISLSDSSYFFVSFTVTTPLKLVDTYGTQLKRADDYVLSYPFLVVNHFDLAKIFSYIDFTFNKIKGSSKKELMLKFSTIMSLEKENITDLLNTPLCSGDTLAFKII